MVPGHAPARVGKMSSRLTISRGIARRQHPPPKMGTAILQLPRYKPYSPRSGDESKCSLSRALRRGAKIS